MSSTETQNITISEPIRKKYVQIFSLQRNISEMSVKTILEKPMRKDFFTPLQQEGDRRGGEQKSKEGDRKGGKRKAAVNRGEGREDEERMEREKEEGWGLALSKC